MAKSKIDAKEFMLRYGDRIGIGIAGLLALMLLVFAFLGGGGGVSADDIKQSSKSASDQIARSQVVPEQIKLTTEPSVKSLEQIDQLARSLTRAIGIDQLQLPHRFFDLEPLRGKFRSNPRVYEAIEIAARPLYGAIRKYETNGDSVMVVTPKGNVQVNVPKDNKFKAGQALGNQPAAPGTGLSMGMGGMAGLGGSQPGASGRPGGRSGGFAGKFRGGPGNVSSPKPPPSTSTPGGADEAGMSVQWVKDTQVKQSDMLGVSVLPVHAPYIVAAFPHGQQAEEIAKALQLGNKGEVENYYKGLEVQRRFILPRGKRMPDGNYALADMVLVPNPANAAEQIWKPLAEVNNPAAGSDMAFDEKQRERAAGWEDVNNLNVAREINLAVSVALSNNEGFYAEKDPIVEQLIQYAGPRVTLRLPRLVRGDYPDLYKQLQRFMGAIDQIEKDKKARIPKPPRDPRTRNPEIKPDDPFGLEERTTEQTTSKDPSKPDGESPDLTGSVPDLILLRFIDADLRLGERFGDLETEVTLEYRLRVVLFNPNYKDEKNVADPIFATQQYLTSPGWSPIARVTFSPDAIAYSDERVREKNRTTDNDKDKAPIQMQKWLYGVETTDKQAYPVGEWWVERLMISRGEYIGKYPDVPGPAGIANVIVWISSAWDAAKQMVGGDVQKPLRTYDLMSKSLLVDFTGGYYQAFQSSVRNRRVNEEIPCETLILEPDGRLVARYYSDDKNDAARKDRFTKWEEWLKGLPKEKRAPAQPGGNNAGGGSVGS